MLAPCFLLRSQLSLPAACPLVASSLVSASIVPPDLFLQVVLVANSLPAINDVTAAELRSVSALRDYAVLHPALAVSHHFCTCTRSALWTSGSALLIAYSVLEPSRRWWPRRRRRAPSSAPPEMPRWPQRPPTTAASRPCRVRRRRALLPA